MNNLPTFEETWSYMLSRMDDSQLMKQVRTELGFTQSEMAEKAGYNSKDAISKIERGKKGLSGPARKCLHYLSQLEGITTNSESL